MIDGVGTAGEYAGHALGADPAGQAPGCLLHGPGFIVPQDNFLKIIKPGVRFNFRQRDPGFIFHFTSADSLFDILPGEFNNR